MSNAPPNYRGFVRDAFHARPKQSNPSSPSAPQDSKSTIGDALHGFSKKLNPLGAKRVDKFLGCFRRIFARLTQTIKSHQHRAHIQILVCYQRRFSYPSTNINYPQQFVHLQNSREPSKLFCMFDYINQFPRGCY